MARDGAQIIDVGGESTRPGAEPISADEELRRVLPVIEKLREKVSAFISIDTSKAEVAHAALEAGASIINDVTGGRGDGEMIPLVAKRKAAFIIMHMQGEPRTMQIDPRYDDVVAKWPIFFDNNMSASYNQALIPWLLRLIRESGSVKRSNIIWSCWEISEHCACKIVRSSSAFREKASSGKLPESKEMSDRFAPTIALTALLRAQRCERIARA